MEPSKSDLSFDDLLRAGLGVPPKDTPSPEETDGGVETEQSSEESSQPS